MCVLGDVGFILPPSTHPEGEKYPPSPKPHRPQDVLGIIRGYDWLLRSEPRRPKFSTSHLLTFAKHFAIFK